jgi:hypothetical protein
MLDVATLLSRIPHASIQTKISLPITVVIYSAIIAMLIVMQRSVRGKM